MLIYFADEMTKSKQIHKTIFEKDNLQKKSYKILSKIWNFHKIIFAMKKKSF